MPRLDPKAGIVAFAEDLPRVLRLCEADTVEQLGWRKLNDLTLLVPMVGQRGDVADNFTLKLGFQAYRAWPPSAQFVNPTTCTFTVGPDDQWVPRLTSEECRTHLSYPKPGGGTTQLICCSATMEFYDVAHDVDDTLVWSDKSTFYSTIVAIRRAFETNYEGPFRERG